MNPAEAHLKNMTNTTIRWKCPKLDGEFCKTRYVRCEPEKCLYYEMFLEDYHGK